MSDKPIFAFGGGRSLQAARVPDPKADRSLQALINKTNTSAKEQVVDFGANIPNEYLLRRPSGVVDLDVKLKGGLPAASVHVFAGPEGAGKTTLLYMYMAMQQRIFGGSCRLALVVAEQLPDYIFMRKLGLIVPVPEGTISQLNEIRKRCGRPGLTKEELVELRRQVGTFVIINAPGAEQTFDIATDFIENGSFNIVGIDSFSMLETKAENDTAEDKGFEKSPQQAAGASLITRWAKHIQPSLRRVGARTTVIGICQVRANRKKSELPGHMAKYAPDYAISAPWSLRHQASTVLMVLPGEKMKEDTGEVDRNDRKVKSQVGKQVRVRTDKGKFGIHEGISAEFELNFENPFNIGENVLLESIDRGIAVEKNGKFLFQTTDGAAMTTEPMTREAAVTRINSDLEFELSLRLQIFRAENIECLFW